VKVVPELKQLLDEELSRLKKAREASWMPGGAVISSQRRMRARITTTSIKRPLFASAVMKRLQLRRSMSKTGILVFPLRSY
jgi:hypothetical protein